MGRVIAIANQKGVRQDYHCGESCGCTDEDGQEGGYYRCRSAGELHGKSGMYGKWRGHYSESDELSGSIRQNDLCEAEENER